MLEIEMKRFYIEGNRLRDLMVVRSDEKKGNKDRFQSEKKDKFMVFIVTTFTFY